MTIIKFERSKLWASARKSIQVSLVDGLTEDEQTMFASLVELWSNKLVRNQKRVEYYDMKNHFKDLGISIPPQLKKLKLVTGWPAKAVDLLAARSRFDGFVFEGEDVSGLTSALRDNAFAQSYKEASTSELIHSCSFLTISKGAVGEPQVIIMPHSAINAAAIWDYRRRRIKCGLVIIDVDEKTKQPCELNLYTDGAVIEIISDGASWVATRHSHSQGRPLMEVLRYKPSIDRPMGKSRINRAVMSITDNAVREILRTEVSAEFFTSPQRYILGADDSAFDRGKWEQYIASLAVFSKDMDGESPTYGQLPQMSMQPHMDYMRSLAAQFAGETGIPISSLGVIHDNPSSAEAIYAAREDLIIECDGLNDTNGLALRNIGLLTLAIMQGKKVSQLTDNELTLMPRFKNPAKPSVVSQSDAMVKQASVAGWLAETRVFLEELGYTDEQIARMQSDKRKAEAKETLKNLFGDKDVTGN
jgi:hypothetical protein